MGGIKWNFIQRLSHSYLLIFIILLLPMLQTLYNSMKKNKFPASHPNAVVNPEDKAVLTGLSGYCATFQALDSSAGESK